MEKGNGRLAIQVFKTDYVASIGILTVLHDCEGMKSLMKRPGITDDHWHGHVHHQYVNTDLGRHSISHHSTLYNMSPWTLSKRAHK